MSQFILEESEAVCNLPKAIEHCTIMAMGGPGSLDSCSRNDSYLNAGQEGGI